MENPADIRDVGGFLLPQLPASELAFRAKIAELRNRNNKKG
jgi:hypothetical protein